MKRITAITILTVLLLCGVGWAKVTTVVVQRLSAASSTTVTFGPYENNNSGSNFSVGAGSSGTSLVCAAMSGGGPATTWVGFYVVGVSGLSGDALITGWTEATDTAILASDIGLSEGDTFKITTRYPTAKDTIIKNIPGNTNKTFGNTTPLMVENDTTNQTYQWLLIHIDMSQLTGITSITSASLYVYSITSFLAGTCDFVAGRVIDGSASPNATMWTEDNEAFNVGPTYEYKDDDTTLDWEADSSNNFEDVIGTSESSATSVSGSTDAVWISFDIGTLLETIRAGATNLGLYVHNTTADTGYMQIGSKETATTTQRWFIKVTAQ